MGHQNFKANVCGFVSVSVVIFILDVGLGIYCFGGAFCRFFLSCYYTQNYLSILVVVVVKFYSIKLCFYRMERKIWIRLFMQFNFYLNLNQAFHVVQFLCELHCNKYAKHWLEKSCSNTKLYIQAHITAELLWGLQWDS